MSKIAIKNFFDREREVTARMKAYFRRMEKQMNAPKEEVIDTHAFDKEVEYFDVLLKRNWFLDSEGIEELLMDADEEVFQVIVDRAHTYPENVRAIIYSFLPISTSKYSKLKIRDITDEQMDLQEFKEKERKRKELSDGWEAYKVNQKLEPPVGYLDAELDDMFSELQELKKNLEDAKKKSLTGRYVPPAMREKVAAEDSHVIEITKQIQKAENEILLQNQRIEQEHHEWFVRKRNEFEQAMLAL
jgi:hypothetical protein